MSLVDVKTALRRDFKIMGVIGGEEQKDQLSFVSLTLSPPVVTYRFYSV